MITKFLKYIGLVALGAMVGGALTASAAAPITQPVNGGTGTGIKPTLGQVLVGTAGGVYQPQATSTLGLGGGGGGSGTVTQVNTTFPILGGPITTTGTLSFGGLGTTSPFTAGLLAEIVNGNTIGGVSTTSATCAGNSSCSAFTIIGSTPVSISSSGVTSIIADSPLTGGTITTSGHVGCQLASSSQNGCLSSTDWSTFNSKGAGTVTSVATNNGLTGGTITSTGTIGLNILNLSAGALVEWSGSALQATGTPALTAGYYNATSTTATSTFANGINVTGGCVEVSGSCLSSGGGASGTTASYLATSTGQTTYLSSIPMVAGNVLMVWSFVPGNNSGDHVDSLLFYTSNFNSTSTVASIGGNNQNGGTSEYFTYTATTTLTVTIETSTNQSPVGAKQLMAEVIPK